MRPWAAALAVAAVLACSRPAPGQAATAVQAQTPELRIESFAPTRPYAVGLEPVALVAVVRNVGSAPLPEGSVTARLVCLAALDYLEGDTSPKLPTLAPNATTTLRWRTVPTDPEGAIVAALALTAEGRPPQVRVLAVQHFAEAPKAGVPSPAAVPVARGTDNEAVIENGRVRARVQYSAANVPGLFMYARAPAGWRQAAVSIPIIELESGEGAQRTWWEVFRADDASTAMSAGQATLTLSGGVGLRWRATVELTLRTGSSVIDCRLRLSPLRTVKLSAVRAWPLAVVDAGPDVLGPEPSAASSLWAARSGDATVGTIWPNAGPFAGWQGAPLPDVGGVEYKVLGAEWRTPGPPVELAPGALVELRGRIYALSPSRSAADARKVFLPTGK